MGLEFLKMIGPAPIPRISGFAIKTSHWNGHMMTLRTCIVVVCMTGLTSLAFAQSSPKTSTARIAAADAKSHVGEKVTVCGKVVDSKVSDPGVGPGKPVTFHLDQPQPNPVFAFITFGTKDGGPQEAIAAYQDKQVCVTGKVAAGGDSVPFIITMDRTQIRVQAGNK